MSGTAFTDLTQVVIQQQMGNQILAAIQQQLVAGVAVTAAPPSYTVAALPATAATGQFAWASNGRKIGEGSGSGTGVPVYFNGATSQWFTFQDVVVLA